MIYGERVRLRSVEREDLPRFVAWLNDPEVRQNLSLLNPLSQAMEESWFEAMLKRPAEEMPLVIEVRQGEGWTPVGNCSLFGFHWAARTAEVGIFIGEKSLWGQGYGTEAMRLMLRHGFHDLNLNRIFLRVYASNPRAVRSYEKAGFTLEGRERQGTYLNGQYVDVLLMSILHSEFQEPPAAG